jgi:hypothetical protein
MPGLLKKGKGGGGSIGGNKGKREVGVSIERL